MGGGELRNMKVTVIAIAIDALVTISKGLVGCGAERVGNQRTSRNHPKYSIVKIGQNTEKSPSDLKRLPVPQTPLKSISER